MCIHEVALNICRKENLVQNLNLDEKFQILQKRIYLSITNNYTYKQETFEKYIPHE